MNNVFPAKYKTAVWAAGGLGCAAAGIAGAQFFRYSAGQLWPRGITESLNMAFTFLALTGGLVFAGTILSFSLRKGIDGKLADYWRRYQSRGIVFRSVLFFGIAGPPAGCL